MLVATIQPSQRQQSPSAGLSCCTGERDVGASGKEQISSTAKGAPGCRPHPATWVELQMLLMAAGLLHCSWDKHWTPSSEPSSQPQEVLLTWHDDIRKSQFSCNCQSPIKYHRVFSPNLFHVSTKKLQRHDKTCKNKSIFFLRTTPHPVL